MTKIIFFVKKYSSFVGIIVGFTILFVIVYYVLSFFLNLIQNYTNSLYINVSITLFVGLSAYIIYLKQQFDKKRDAAKIIFLEIQYAAKSISSVRAAQMSSVELQLPYEIKTVKSESWTIYKYLFSSDFNQDEWEAITSFYNLCKLYDEAVENNNSYNEKNFDQFRIHIQDYTAACVKEHYEKLLKASTSSRATEISKLIEDKIKNYTNIFLAVARQYHPQDPTLRTKGYLSRINTDILLTSVGIKLRDLAGI